MFRWFDNPFRRPKYPTWNDVPDWNKVNQDMNKVTEDMEKIIPFPETSKTPPMPSTETPKKEPSTVYYRLGITSDNRVSLQVGYSEVTMNSVGVDNLIAQLEMFRDHINNMVHINNMEDEE